MLLGETLWIALQSIRGNLFRAALTMLGIVIGVAAVITMVALGTGAQRAIDEQMEALGGDILSISSSSRFSPSDTRQCHLLRVLAQPARISLTGIRIVYRILNMTHQRLLSNYEAVDVLRITIRSLNRLVRDEAIPFIQLPHGQIRFDRNDLLRWAASLKHPAAG